MNKKLKDWTAKRAGAGITISGRDATTGDEIKIAGVNRIEGGRAHALGGVQTAPIAVDKNGVKYELA